jgi:hypothetical protein
MKIFKKLLLSLFVAGAVTSCGDDYFDVNDSQVNPTFSTPELSLPVAQKYSVDSYQGGYNSYNTLGNLWAYTWAAGGDFIFFTDETLYQVNTSFRTGMFNTTYLLPLRNYDVIEKNTDPQYSNYVAIAKIMKAYHFQNLVDAYGDVPYFEALQGAANTAPAYTPAKEIYDDLLVQLTAAQALISGATTTTLTPGALIDVMNGGDMNKWSRFANTLKLRILLRQSNNNVTDFSSVNNGIGFITATENVTCNPGYINDTNKQNPYFAAFGLTVAGDPAANRNACRVTPFALSLVPATDGRRPRLFSPAASNGAFTGIDQNSNGGATAATRSGVGPGILKSSSQNAILMSGSESAFLQAEAVLRGRIAGNAQALTAAGIQASFDQLGAVGAAPIIANYDGSIQFVITQKFIANMHLNGFENYTEFRRTGFPAVRVAPVDGKLPTASQTPIAPNVPVRLLYPQSEVNTNPNVPAQSVQDAFTNKIFWDN